MDGNGLEKAMQVKLKNSDFDRLSKIAKDMGDIPESTLARIYVIDGIKRQEALNAEESASK